jgi:RecA-family ATPase
MNSSGIEKVKFFLDDKIDRFHELNQPEKGKAFIRSAQEILEDDSNIDFIVDEIIPVSSLGVIVGETGAGKSFYALDIAMCVVTGTDFHGSKVKKMNCAYVAAEGNRGYRRRMKAWMRKHNWQGSLEGFFLTSGAVDLFDTEKLKEIVLFCEANEIGIVFFDTFHRCFSGEENSAKDVGTALQNIGKFFTENGIAVVLVHHSGHTAAGRGRGSSSLKAGVDFELLLEKCEGGLKVTPTKIKDGELSPSETFRLVKQDTGWFDDKDAISSLVLERGEVKKIVRLNKKESQMWAALKALGSSFNRDAAERATFGMIETKNKGQALTRFLTKLSSQDQLNFDEGNYMILN